MTAVLETPTNTIKSLALELTGLCQNTCSSHCYAGSGPQGTHGTMTRTDWEEVLRQASAAGVRMVQYIGGEPTLHPYLPQLIRRALDFEMRVEVFSNLVHIRSTMWEALALPGVSLATSYYSDSEAEHEEITGGRGSYKRTKGNITEAIRRGIPLRGSLVHVLEDQRVNEARAELRSLGVTGEIRLDRVRAIGKGSTDVTFNDPNELCGRCGVDRAAISPDGVVTPCVMSRWLPAGNVRAQSLTSILSGPLWQQQNDVIPRTVGGCVPDSCTPKEDSCDPSPGADDFDTLKACNPDKDGGDCSPAETPACNPKH
ncbi:radical SAM protein [Streptomyces sp. 21So2-11]|uniref:radical SAM protein n=1 Tax=Streptomyces sp. 21So2-11 TaxID=3144408 RepID=UPI0032194E10